MKPGLSQLLLRRIQDVVARDTGAALSPAAEREIEALLGKGGAYSITPGHEFLSREVTILLADLRGFTAIAGTYPADVVIRMLNPCLIKMSEIIFRHLGSIDKFMGDSIMVLFGAPVSRPDDVQRAVLCAVEMQQAMNALNLAHKIEGLPELYMGIGINTGEVLAGMLGSEHYAEYTVIGNEVNLASRIEAFSLRGQVLIGQNTYERCKDFVETSAPVDIHVKGKPEPVSLREVVAIPALGLKVPRQEVRRSHRVEVKLPFNYQLIDQGIVMPEILSGVIRDISYQGVQVAVDKELELYSEMKLDFVLPLVDHEVTDTYAKVVCHKSSGGLHQYGLEFTSTTPATNSKLQLFVQLLVFTDLN